MKKIIIAVILIIISAGAFRLAFDIQAEIQKERDRNFKIRSAIYTDAASVRIFDEWQCIAPDQSVKFIRSLMEQLAPNDAAAIDRIYTRKAELKEKEELRSLTIAERKELNSINLNITEPSSDALEATMQRIKDFNANIDAHSFNIVGTEDTPRALQSSEQRSTTSNNGLNGHFAMATCGIDSFTASLLGIAYTQQPCSDTVISSVQNENREITIRYQDQFTRWQLNPARIFEKQFQAMTETQQQEAINRIYEYEQAKLALEEQAQRQVDKTTAILVPEDGEAAFQKTVFLRLFCEKRGTADRQLWAPHNLLNKNGYF